MPYTSKKCGNRYNTLLRQSSSATNGGVAERNSNSTNNSFVSPRNLMFGGGNGNGEKPMTQPKFSGIDLSGIDVVNASPTNIL